MGVYFIIAAGLYLLNFFFTILAAFFIIACA